MTEELQTALAVVEIKKCHYGFKNLNLSQYQK